jgi:hypothetical protein
MNAISRLCDLPLGPFTRTVFFDVFGAYTPGAHAETVRVNARPLERHGARSLPRRVNCRSPLVSL